MDNTRPGILQVNTTDSGGGAARVALDLHHEYLGRGLPARLAVGFKVTEVPGVVEIPGDAARTPWARSLRAAADRVGGMRPGSSLVARAAALKLLVGAEPARYVDIWRGVEDFHYPGTRWLEGLLGPDTDILHIHNMHGGYFDIRELPRLSASQPTVLTLHDAWLLTGHCAHPMDCQGWLSGCRECPAPERYVEVRADGSATSWRIKRAAIAGSRLAFATPSEWLMRMVRDAGLLDTAIASRVIPNGVDPRVFSPGDRSAARETLSLPHTHSIVLFAAHGLRTNPFKDYPTLERALPIIGEAADRSLLLVALGDTGPLEPIGDVEVLRVPYVADPARVAEYLRAADVYVHPARAENFPLAIIEAMACGTPVVASSVGGIPEIIADGKTGALVPPGDPAALAQAVRALLGDEARRISYARAASDLVVERFTLERQASAYLGWYAELMARTSL